MHLDGTKVSHERNTRVPSDGSRHDRHGTRESLAQRVGREHQRHGR